MNDTVRPAVTRAAGGERVAVIGAGNLGGAIARGLLDSGRVAPSRMALSRRSVEALAWASERGCAVSADNRAVLGEEGIVLVAVEPVHLDHVLGELAPALQPAHLLVSVIAGIDLAGLRRRLGRDDVRLVRAMPNTAVTLRESMTCLSTDGDAADVARVASLFDALGATAVVDDAQMAGATALAASGLAFFMRAIRAAQQAGTQVGFKPDQARHIVAQTARGAASLLLAGEHPEAAIDRVTTPSGTTITGLNEMERQGFSAAMMAGVLAAAARAAGR